MNEYHQLFFFLGSFGAGLIGGSALSDVIIRGKPEGVGQFGLAAALFAILAMLRLSAGTP